MEIPRNDVLPDPSPADSEVHKTPEPVAPAPVDEPAQPAAPAKPPEGYVPYQALNEERARRKELEQKLKEIESSPSSLTDEEYSEEGKALRKEISRLNERFNSLEHQREEERVMSAHPILKDKSAEFEEFRAEYPGVKLDKVARLFIAENGLTEAVQPRIGLEKPTGGSKNAPASGISADEVDRIMKSDHRKFIKMVRDPKTNPDEIH